MLCCTDTLISRCNRQHRDRNRQHRYTVIAISSIINNIIYIQVIKHKIILQQIREVRIVGIME